MPDDEKIRQTVTEQMAVFGQAATIHADRTRQYGDLWKEDGPLEHSFQTKHKASRLHNTLMDARCAKRPADLEAVKESALDLINYAGFIVRQVEAQTDPGEDRCPACGSTDKDEYRHPCTERIHNRWHWIVGVAARTT